MMNNELSVSVKILLSWHFAPPSYTYPIHLYQPPRHPGAGTSLPHTHSRTTHFFSLVQLAKPSIGKWNYDASTWSKRENSVAWEWFEDLAECPTLTKLWSPQGQVFSFCAQTLNIPVFDQKVVSCCCPRDGELQIRIFRIYCECCCGRQVQTAHFVSVIVRTCGNWFSLLQLWPLGQPFHLHLEIYNECIVWNPR